jgi:hypothetical protein
MGLRGLVVAATLCAGGAGCSPFLQDGVRNVTEAPVRKCDDIKLCWRARHLAAAAWAQVRRSAPKTFSADYAEGFKDGYADYVIAGGNGEPPGVPPFRYRLTPYASPAGHQAIEDWYAGFRHGAAVARASGERENVVIPLSAPPINAVDLRAGDYGPPSPPPPPQQPPRPAVEELPPPRVLPGPGEE